jgi:hypothetical protein
MVRLRTNLELSYAILDALELNVPIAARKIWDIYLQIHF